MHLITLLTSKQKTRGVNMRASLLSLLFLMIGLFSNFVFANIKCNDPLRDSYVCYHMHNLRSQVHLLGAQRDLMRVDYTFLSSVADDMKAVVLRVQEKSTGNHMSGLTQVADLADQLKRESTTQQSQSLATANAIQKACMNCHTSGGNGHSWEEISKNDWDTITKKCNDVTPGRIPYLCKHMYGMFKIIDYFYTAVSLDVLNFSTVVKTSGELKRIATDLHQKRMVHFPGDNNNNFFEEVIQTADDLIASAQKEDPTTIAKMQNATHGCMKCHGIN